MEQLKQMVILACLACVIGGIIKALVPDHRSGSAIHMMIALFMIAIVMLPVAKGADAWYFSPFSLQQMSPDTDAFQQIMLQAAVSEVEKTVDVAAKEQGILAKVVAVEPTLADGKVWIQSITLTVEGTKQEANQLKSVLEKIIDARIVVSWTEATYE